MLKITISTSVWSAQHPNTDRNIQHLLFRWVHFSSCPRQWLLISSRRCRLTSKKLHFSSLPGNCVGITDIFNFIKTLSFYFLYSRGGLVVEQCVVCYTTKLNVFNSIQNDLLFQSKDFTLKEYY